MRLHALPKTAASSLARCGLPSPLIFWLKVCAPRAPHVQRTHMCPCAPMRSRLPIPLFTPTLQVMRLSSQDVPTAYAYELEAATIVQSSQVRGLHQAPGLCCRRPSPNLIGCERSKACLLGGLQGIGLLLVAFHCHLCWTHCCGSSIKRAQAIETCPLCLKTANAGSRGGGVGMRPEGGAGSMSRQHERTCVGLQQQAACSGRRLCWVWEGPDGPRITL